MTNYELLQVLEMSGFQKRRTVNLVKILIYLKCTKIVKIKDFITIVKRYTHIYLSILY